MNKQSKINDNFLWIDKTLNIALDILKIVIPPASLAFSIMYGWNYVGVKALPTVAVSLDISLDNFARIWLICYFLLLSYGYKR
ncbi:MAG TPA: hypothetical protein V6C58_21455 [Allocoleopsis sp.]